MSTVLFAFRTAFTSGVMPSSGWMMSFTSLLFFFSDHSTAAWPSRSRRRMAFEMRSVWSSSGTCTS